MFFANVLQSKNIFSILSLRTISLNPPPPPPVPFFQRYQALWFFSGKSANNSFFSLARVLFKNCLHKHKMCELVYFKNYLNNFLTVNGQTVLNSFIDYVTAIAIFFVLIFCSVASVVLLPWLFLFIFSFTFSCSYLFAYRAYWLCITQILFTTIMTFRLVNPLYHIKINSIFFSFSASKISI